MVLVEGAISVFPNQGDEHKIHPGELAVLNGVTQDVQISKVDIEPYIAWNNGRFVFDNCSLETLMEVISRWYDKKIMFEDEDIKTIRFTRAITSSNRSSESAPRSSLKEVSAVIPAASQFNCSAIISLIFSNIIFSSPLIQAPECFSFSCSGYHLFFIIFVKQMMILLFLVFNLIIRQTSKYVSFIQIWFYRD